MLSGVSELTLTEATAAMDHAGTSGCGNCRFRVYGLKCRVCSPLVPNIAVCAVRQVRVVDVRPEADALHTDGLRVHAHGVVASHGVTSWRSHGWSRIWQLGNGELSLWRA